MQQARRHVVAYCTDVEGCFSFWERYVDVSRVLRRDPDTGRLTLPEGAHFVFGGDAVDQGAGDLAFLRDLLDLRDDHPGRVHIVLGNRDINKMRLLGELSPAHARRVPWSEYRGVYWRAPSDADRAEFRATPDTPAARLKWILSNTMGSGRTFELRRQELMGAAASVGSAGKETAAAAAAAAAIAPHKRTTTTTTPVSDDDVCDSFVASLSPGGLMRRYLQAGQLGLVWGDTLFVHGALSPSVMGWLPPSAADDNDDNGGGEPDARRWISRLNAFCRDEVQAWCGKWTAIASREGDTEGLSWADTGGYVAPEGQFPGANLMQYGMGWLPSGERNRTLIYRDWMGKPQPADDDDDDDDDSDADEDQDGSSLRGGPNWRPKRDVVAPRVPEPGVVSYLNRAGIRRVVCGHKPHGDAALVLRAGADAGNGGDGLQVITVDTSYSGKCVVLEDQLAQEALGCRHRGEEGDTRRAARFAKGADDDRRGCAVSELIIEFDADGSASRALVHGVDSNGDLYECCPDDPDQAEGVADGHELVGSVTKAGGWVVKGRRLRDGAFLISRLRGWDPENKYVSEGWLRKALVGGAGAGGSSSGGGHCKL